MEIQLSPDSIVVKIIAVILFIIGVYVLIYSIYDVFRSYKSMFWVPVEAVMIKNVISYSENVSYNDGRKEVSHIYRPEISYKYEVRGFSYTGNRIYWMDALMGNSHLTAPMHVLDFIGETDPGERFAVYFDPDNHGRSVVFRGISNYGICSTCIGLLAAALCLYAAITILTKV